MPEDQFKCAKCGHKECTIQLRIIKVTVGFQQFQTAGIAPARMCIKCGDKSTNVNYEIGDLAGLIQDPGDRMPQLGAGQSSTQLTEAIANLTTMREQVLAQEKAITAAEDKRKRKAARDAVSKKNGGKKKATKKKATKKKATKKKARK